MNINNIFTNISSGFLELKNRILFVLGTIFLFRLGSFIPIPGIDTNLLFSFLNKNNSGFIDMFNMFSGGSLFHTSIFTLGIVPYISASIIIQLLTIVYPYFIELKKEGINGKYILNQYTRYLTLFISIIQSVFISLVFINLSDFEKIGFHLNYNFYFVCIISLISGTMFLMWLGEQITERGIGNGVSMIIFIGIISSLPKLLFSFIGDFVFSYFNFLKLMLVLCIMLLLVFFIVFIESAQRKILIQSSFRRQNTKYSFLSAQDTYLPLKINMVGVIPSIFSSSIMIFISSILLWLYNLNKFNFINFLFVFFNPKKFVFILVHMFLIVTFSFFYTFLVFNSRETAENLKKSGSYIPGLRPGYYTSKYIDKVIYSLTLFSTMYVSIVCLFPEFMQEIIGLPFSFGGTSLLIIVVVTIEFIFQVQTLIMSNQYLSIFKKSNFI